VAVYPGFTAAFDVIGSCFETPFIFKDKSTVNYGVIDSWKWDFGETVASDDTSSLQNPVYKYSGAGVKSTQLRVTSSKGCVDTLTIPVEVRNEPFLKLSFSDTLICSGDTLSLLSEGTGTFNWTPSNNVINQNSSNAFVFPNDTATYVVTLTDANGCVKSDSVKVNVLDLLNVNAGADTTLCKTDSMLLQPVSQGLQWEWTPAAGLSSPTAKNPVASPDATTAYRVTARVGKCKATDDITVKVVAYPTANAGGDISVCYGERKELNASIVGASFAWTPVNSLLNSTTLKPTATPSASTSYILTVNDTQVVQNLPAIQ
jgi:PKD repeat protein